MCVGVDVHGTVTTVAGSVKVMSNVPENADVEPGLQADQRLLDRGWLKIGAGLAVAAQAMVFSLAVNLSEIESAWAYWIVHGILVFAAFATLYFLGDELLRSAWEALRARKISIDLLFLVTLSGALGGSLVSTFTQTGSVYYEVVAVLIVVHTAGKMLGARSRLTALQAAENTRARFDSCERITPDGRPETVRVAEIVSGDRIRVAPGAAIAVDGEIVEGRGYVQETSMTGEWHPVSRGPGERVLAGTYSVDGSFVVCASAGPRRLDAILTAVERARLAPSRLQAQADRLMAWFLPLVVSVSVLTFVFWWFYAPWERALFNSMAVLLVACPCAMGLATPVAVWGGLARMSRFGLVARTGDFLDGLGRADHLCLDKTGTLSADALTVKAWHIEPAFVEKSDWLRAAVVAVEAGLTHPVAAALRAECHVLRDTFSASIDVRDREIVPGLGVIAELRDTDAFPLKIGVGEPGLQARCFPEGGASTEECHVLRDTFSEKNIWVFVGGKAAARIELAERWRDGLAESLTELRALGVTTEVLSGDPEAERALGVVMGADAGDAFVVRGGMTPDMKHARVQSLVEQGRFVAFFGDGVNDASAMSAAQVSVAMRSGAELARASSMAVFAGEDWRFLPQAIRVARATRKGIRGNMLFASIYNITGMALAASGKLHPVAAALLMVVSSVLVSIRALRSSNVK